MTCCQKMSCMIVGILLFNLMVVLPLFSCSCLAVMSMLTELIKTYWWSFKTAVATGAFVDHNEVVMTPVQSDKNVILSVW